MTGLARRVNNDPDLVPSSHAYGFFVIASEAKQSRAKKEDWIASSRSLSSGAHSRDPLAPRNDGKRSVRRRNTEAYSAVFHSG